MNQLWRNAATTIIAAKVSLPHKAMNALPKSKYDYKLLLLKRSSKSTFMPNAYVFPGGITENIDYDPQWLKIIGEHVLDRTSGRLPPLLAFSNKAEVTQSTALRLCGMREIFEECGILLSNELIPNEILCYWRERVLENQDNFLQIFQQQKIKPEINKLHLWRNWLTPIDLPRSHSRRYDTLFFFLLLDQIPQHSADNKEIVASEWLNPEEVLDKFYSKERWIAPPQLYEMETLKTIKNFEKLQNYVFTRSDEGCDRWLPVRINALDGVLSVLPGDSLYPECPDVEGVDRPRSLDSTIQELRDTSQYLHRFELDDNHMWKNKLVLNLKT